MGKWKHEMGTGLVLGLEKLSCISPDAFLQELSPQHGPQLSLVSLSPPQLFLGGWDVEWKSVGLRSLGSLPRLEIKVD